MPEFFTLENLIAAPALVAEFFRSPEFARAIDILKSVSAAVSVLLGAGIVMVLIKTNFIGSKIKTLAQTVSHSSFPKKKILKSWTAVVKRLQSQNEASFKLALIEADKIFDDLLKRIGYQGDTMAERLKRINKAQLSTIEDIWQAHKLRNNLVHHPDFHLTHEEAAAAIGAYEKAMKELQVLE